MKSRKGLRWLLMVAVIALVAAACGGASQDDVDAANQRAADAEAAAAEAQAAVDAAVAAAQEAATGAQEEAQAALEQAQADLEQAQADAAAALEAAESGGDDRAVIRFAFAPDPAWDWLVDTGQLAAWQAENNIDIFTNESWDEFTYFAGGHGDIVSMGTQEIPVLEDETSVRTVTFGKYNYQRSPMMRRAGDSYETLADVPLGSTICVSSPVSNTGFWTVAANELHGLDYRVGGGDFNLIVNDHFVNPTNLLRGDCEVAVIIPEAAAPHLRVGEIELMYDGLMPFQLYNTFSGLDDGQKHVMSNLFTATEEWYDNQAGTGQAEAFLDLWQQGVDEWNANQAEIIAKYPQHFAVESEEDIQWMIDFMADEANDWFVESVYLDDTWVESERAIWDMMIALDPENPNSLPEGFPQPRFEVIAAP